MTRWVECSKLIGPEIGGWLEFGIVMAELLARGVFVLCQGDDAME
jgi:hypothetical protein